MTKKLSKEQQRESKIVESLIEMSETGQLLWEPQETTWEGKFISADYVVWIGETEITLSNVTGSLILATKKPDRSLAGHPALHDLLRKLYYFLRDEAGKKDRKLTFLETRVNAQKVHVLG